MEKVGLLVVDAIAVVKQRKTSARVLYNTGLIQKFVRPLTFVEGVAEWTEMTGMILRKG